MISSIGFIASHVFTTCDMRNSPRNKNWAWLRPIDKFTEKDYQRLFAKMRAAGISAVLPEIYNSWEARYRSNHLPNKEQLLEMILPIAMREELEVHAWMWSMPCNIKEIHERHPEWFAVNRNGESALNKPAYVDYYKFMCPNRQGVQEFVQQTVEELAHIKDLTGIHLDYIRLPDVILAAGLQPNYNIVQDREYPEYDYCYCDVCREKFKKKTGIDPLTLDDPSQNEAWRQFRYDSISHLVNDKLVPIARKHNKVITAAVFPNWEMVRQEWRTWNLDAVLPMLYNNFYNEGIDWIRLQTEKGITSLPESVAYYSGLFVPELQPDELVDAIKLALAGGADGISLFDAGSVTDAHWEKIKGVLENASK